MKKLLIFVSVPFILLALVGCLFVYGMTLVSPTVTDSMEPTFRVFIDWQRINPFQSPKIGDIVNFKCLREDKCGLKDGTPEQRISHRLTSISPDGCMTIIGDNPKYDWSKVPCYMPEDIEILGVVHKL